MLRGVDRDVVADNPLCRSWFKYPPDAAVSNKYSGDPAVVGERSDQRSSAFVRVVAAPNWDRFGRCVSITAASVFIVTVVVGERHERELRRVVRLHSPVFFDS